MTRLGKTIRRAALAGLVLAAVAAAGLAGDVRRGVEAGLVLADLAAGPGDSLFKRLTPPPLRRELRYTLDGTARSGDLYRPGDGSERGALVLVPGAARSGKDDPRLVALATTLARAGLVVLVPDIVSLRALEVSAADSRPIADAVRWLARGYGGGIGIAAISYATGPAVLAALALPRVDLLVTVGGYYDVTRVVTFFTTGFVRAGGDWVPRQPNAYGKWVFVASNAARLTDPGDQVALAAISARKMADLDAPIADLVAHLTDQGRAVMALLDNRDPDRVPALMAALPPVVRDQMAALDLSHRDLSGLHAEAILIHGRDDRIVPAEESVALAAALPHARLVLLDHLAHADLTPGGLSDTGKVWLAVVDLLGSYDRFAGHGA